MTKAKIMQGYEYLRLMISGVLISILIIILLGLHLHNLGNGSRDHRRNLNDRSSRIQQEASE